MIKTPGFWYQNRPGLAAFALWPLSCLYGALVQARPENPRHVPKPVICVGNATAGGSGKTPVVQSLTRILQARGLTPHVLLRGYGGRLKGPVRVVPGHTASDVGDEALLHVKNAPTWICADRYAGAKAAVGAGAGVVVMDDGLQNFTLTKNISFLVIDGQTGIGNGLLLPAGPLREPFTAALERANAAVLIGDDATGVLGKIGGKLVFRAKACGDFSAILGHRVFAFAGLGRPEKFKSLLVAGGIDLAGFKSFPDHHSYTAADMMALLSQAGAATLVTTEKDIVRVPVEFRGRVETVGVSLEWQNISALEAFLIRGVS